MLALRVGLGLAVERHQRRFSCKTPLLTNFKTSSRFHPCALKDAENVGAQRTRELTTQATQLPALNMITGRSFCLSNHQPAPPKNRGKLTMQNTSLLSFWVNVSNGKADGTWNVKKTASTPAEAAALALPCHKVISPVLLPGIAVGHGFKTANGLEVRVLLAA